MTPELNLKTNQGVSDYAAGLALHFNYKSPSHEAALKSKYRSEARCQKLTCEARIGMWTSNNLKIGMNMNIKLPTFPTFMQNK